jgi:RNA polymerase sigma-70 factor (ECF subfamily)
MAWTEFVSLYAPLLHSYGMHRGLQDADAADLAQETLRNVLRAAPEFRYDPARGSFRGWLLAIARNELLKLKSRLDRETAGAGGSEMRQTLEAQAGPADEESRWDREYQLHLFHWACQRVRVEFREPTWNAFWRTVVLGDEIDAVARDLRLTAGAIYVARSRITARLRQEILAVEGGDA